MLTMKRPFVPSNLTRPALTFLLLVGFAAVLFLFLWPSTPARFLVLHRPFRTPVSWRDRFVQWTPATPSWAWMWRLGDKLFGQRKPVNIYGEIVMFPGSTDSVMLAAQVLGKPGFLGQNGLNIWLVQEGELNSLRERLKQTPGSHFVTRPRISTADGVGASLFTGESISLNGAANDVGLKVGCFARVHKESTDLFVDVTYSEALTNQGAITDDARPIASVSIQTNLDVAARLQIPKGSGVVLLKRTSGGGNHNAFGFLIEPL